MKAAPPPGLADDFFREEERSAAPFERRKRSAPPLTYQEEQERQGMAARENKAYVRRLESERARQAMRAQMEAQEREERREELLAAQEARELKRLSQPAPMLSVVDESVRVVRPPHQHAYKVMISSCQGDVAPCAPVYSVITGKGSTVGTLHAHERTIAVPTPVGV